MPSLGSSHAALEAAQPPGAGQVRTGSIAAFETAVKRRRFESTVSFAQSMQLDADAPAATAMWQLAADASDAAAASRSAAFEAAVADWWPLQAAAAAEGAASGAPGVTWVARTWARSLISRRNVGRLRGHAHKIRTPLWKYIDSSQSFA